MDALFDLFGHVCGQQIDHTWLLGGSALPVCQRCTGLYVGAALAAGLWAWFRPRLEGWFLGIHGAFLLGMAPFGFHWIEHGPEVRTLTGFLFGAALTVFLTLWPIEVFGTRTGRRRLAFSPATGTEEERPEAHASDDPRAPATRYFAALGLGGVSLPLVCHVGGVGAALVLTALIVAGAVSLALLLLLQVLALVHCVARAGRRRAGLGAA